MPKKFKEPILIRLIRKVFPVMERLIPSIATRLFYQLFFTPFHYGLPEKEIEWMKKASTTTINIEGRNIVVYEWGNPKNPYLLFIHGWAGRGTQFRKFITPALSLGYRVIAFDGPAHGQSQGKQTNILQFREVVQELIKKFGNPIGTVGHSFGGTVAVYANLTGLPLNKIVTIGTPVIAEKLLGSFLNAIGATQKTGEAFQKKLLKDHGKNFKEFSLEWFLPRIQQPFSLMMFHDKNDREVPIAHAMEAKKLYPSANLVTTEGLGHNRILKDETTVQQALHFFKNEGQ